MALSSIYLSGFRTAGRRWPLALLLFAASCVPSLGFAAAAWSWLANALDNSLATRTLLTDLDMNVFVDLIGHHGDSLWMLLVGGMLLAVGFWLLAVWLNAMTVAAVGDDVSLAAAAHRGLDLYATFLRLNVLAVTVDALLVIAAVVVGRWLTRWTAESPSEMTIHVIVGGTACVGATLLLFFTTVHDHARIHCVATGTGATGAYIWAFGFVATRERRALPLTLMLLITSGAGWLVYQTLGMLIATASMPGVFLSLLWGEVLILCRMFLKVWSFAAQTDLQSQSEVAH